MLIDNQAAQLNDLYADVAITSPVVGDTLTFDGTKWVNQASPIADKPEVSGSRGANAALASLLSALDSLGLITDSTTA
jgi:hypothetical protein